MQLFLAIAELPFEPEIVLDQLYAAGQPGLMGAADLPCS